MNIAKDFCDCIISWEVQENRKISSVVHCTYSHGKIDTTIVGDITGTLYTKIPDEVENEYTPILLTPFLHPEMTKASYCDLKIFVSPKLGVKFDRLVIVSTARVTEFYDRNGDMMFLVKGEKITNKTERVKEDIGDRSLSIGSNKSSNQKTSSRWFRNEYILSVDTFEVMVRFCDHLVPNQLLIKYIGVKVVAHDWSVELGNFNLTTPVLGSNTGAHVGSTGSICSNTITINCDKVMDAIQNVNNAVQILTNEVGCSHKGSNPHLSTGPSLDTSNLLKHRRPNSPMTSGAGSPSANYWTGMSTRRSSDISNLQLWLETRLTIIEMTIMKSLDQLSNRISSLEIQLGSQNHTANDSHNNNCGVSVSELSCDVKTESNRSPNESSDERSSSCQRF